MNKAVTKAELDLKNRRSAKRIPVLEDGTITFEMGSGTMPCFVQDTSEMGARIKVDRINYVPSNFRLTISSENFSIDCIVVWRSDKEVGVIFGTGQY